MTAVTSECCFFWEFHTAQLIIVIECATLLDKYAYAGFAAVVAAAAAEKNSDRQVWSLLIQLSELGGPPMWAQCQPRLKRALEYPGSV